MVSNLYAWEQDFISEDWAYTLNGKPVIWVRPNYDTGQEAWAVFDLGGNRIGGLDAAKPAAMSRAVKAYEARQIEATP